MSDVDFLATLDAPAGERSAPLPLSSAPALPLTTGPLPLSSPTFRAYDIAEHLPFGLVVARDDGVLAGANREARRLIGAGTLDHAPKRCADLLDCRGPAGPCRTRCLVAGAAADQQALPEIRIDTAPGIATRALWVTAAPIVPGSVVLHLRAADEGTPSPRAGRRASSAPALRITALGRADVHGLEGSLAGAWLRQRHGVVLKYLVCHRERAVPAEELARALWPQSGRRGVNHVRRFVYALESQLSPRGYRGHQSSFIRSESYGYALDRDRVLVDLDAFELAASEGLRAAAAGRRAIADERLETAIGFYRGALFEDEPHAEWMLAERARLGTLASTCLRELGELRLAGGEFRRAFPVLERLAALEPLDVEVHRTLLQVCLEQGRRKEATRRYAAFKARMAGELGRGPGFTLADVGFRVPGGSGPKS